mgnify:CR=1 FL=1
MSKPDKSKDSRIRRRDMIKTAGITGLAAATGMAASDSASGAESGSTQATNPYGGVPGGGISLAPYYKPTPSVKNGVNYYPGTEELRNDEMRITFMGSAPFPPRLKQAGTCIMVELGNGDRFFFDFGPGCLRNIIGQQIALADVNNFFFTHLHGDHFCDIGYAYCFGPWLGRWWPMEITGPSGRTPKDGTKAMAEGLKQMFQWHSDAFKIFPAGDGFEVNVNEFPWDDNGGVCYNKNGVTVRHWMRSHAKTGASGYRLDWNGLSFVWTGDGRPDELTLEYAKGVDVFVTEVQSDLGVIVSRKYGVPDFYYNYTIDTHHTPHYAVGYIMEKTKPRVAMVTHMEWEHDMIQEIAAGIRLNYDGLFLYGAPDNTVVNVTKDAIWQRDAVLPDFVGMGGMPDFVRYAEMFGGIDKFSIPYPENSRETIQDAKIRAMEIDPDKYTPADVRRELLQTFPKIDPEKFREQLRQLRAQQGR